MARCGFGSWEQRKAEKAAFREQLCSRLANLLTDRGGIFRLMGVVQAAKLRRWISEGECRNIERTLRTGAAWLKATEFYAFRREAGERTTRSPQKPMSLAEQGAEAQSRMLEFEELNAKARLYSEQEQSEEDA